MRVVRDFKCHEQILNLLSFILSDTITLALHFHIGWILKERSGWSIFKDALQESGLLRVRLEHRVREAAFLSLDKSHVQGVDGKIFLDLHNLVLFHRHGRKSCFELLHNIFE